MKNTGALRYIQDKEILNAVLRYEENASLAETRSLMEVDQYNNEFRPAIANIFPISFSKYISESELKSMTKMDTIVHPGRYENYGNFITQIKNELENTKLTNEEMKTLAKAWHFRQERISVGLRYQIKLKEQGAELLAIIEQRYKH
jgi:ArsR family metal-binding transcriptional regulator